MTKIRRIKFPTIILGGSIEAIKLAFDLSLPIAYKSIIWPPKTHPNEKEDMVYWLTVLSLNGLVLTLGENLHNLLRYDWGISLHSNNGYEFEIQCPNIIEFGNEEEVIYRHIHEFVFEFTSIDKFMNMSCFDPHCIDARDMDKNEHFGNSFSSDIFKMTKRCKVEEKHIYVSEKNSDIYFQKNEEFQYDKIIIIYHNEESNHSDVGTYLYKMFDKYIKYDRDNLSVWLYERGGRVEEATSDEIKGNVPEMKIGEGRFFRIVSKFVKEADPIIFHEDMRDYVERIEIKNAERLGYKKKQKSEKSKSPKEKE